MIVDALLWVVNRLAVAALVTIEGLGGWATADPPNWLDNAEGGIQTLFQGGASMGAWLPIQFALGCIGVVLAVKLLALGIRIVRIIASFLTAGGGAAG